MNCHYLATKYEDLCQTVALKEDARKQLMGAAGAVVNYLNEANEQKDPPARRQYLFLAFEALRESLFTLGKHGQISAELYLSAALIKDQIFQVSHAKAGE